MTSANENILAPQNYAGVLEEIKERIRLAQVRATLVVNSELVLLYWEIGRDIHMREEQQGWGKQVITRLSADLRHAFPEMKGFSPRNLTYMRDFAKTWPEESILQEVLAKLTWYHNITLVEKLKSSAERLWYAHQAIEFGWSRNILALQIKGGLYHRQGKALTNFARTLPAP